MKKTALLGLLLLFGLMGCGKKNPPEEPEWRDVKIMAVYPGTALVEDKNGKRFYIRECGQRNDGYDLPAVGERWTVVRRPESPYFVPDHIIMKAE